MSSSTTIISWWFSTQKERSRHNTAALLTNKQKTRSKKGFCFFSSGGDDGCFHSIINWKKQNKAGTPTIVHTKAFKPNSGEHCIQTHTQTRKHTHTHTRTRTRARRQYTRPYERLMNYRLANKWPRLSVHLRVGPVSYRNIFKSSIWPSLKLVDSVASHGVTVFVKFNGLAGDT